MRVCGLFRYPVKSLGGERLRAAELLPERGLRFDRRWGLAVGDLSAMLRADAEWRPWNVCLSLKRTEALAELRARVLEEDSEAPVLEIGSAAGRVAQGRPDAAGERAELEDFLRRELGDERIVLAESENAPLWDVRGTAVSVLNLDSARDLGARMGLGEELAAGRFRANVVLEGAGAWAEEEWLGRRFGVGERGAVLRMTEMTARCAATRVNPETGSRDVNVPSGLVSCYGHSDLGVYAEVVEGGEVGEGDGFAER